MRGGALGRVIVALGAEGAEVRFVGGCVRDALAGRPVTDIDLATPDPPDRVTTLLRRAGLKAVPTGIGHGTVTAVAEGQGFEVTTLRLDVKTFGRHAEVAFTDDWKADAARRDFTFNAMSAAPDGTLHDYFGGRVDLAEGHVRFVGEPAKRIAEDYLRVLRFFRFLAHFGRVAPDTAALEACRAAAPRLTRLSGERVRNELLKLLAAPDPMPALALMRETGVLAVILPEAGGFELLDALAGIDDGDPLRRLGALLDRDPATVAQRLRLSNAKRDRLVRLVPPDPPIEPDMAPATLRRLVYRHGADAVIDAAYLGRARRGAAARGFQAAIELAQHWARPTFPLKGRDIIAAGVPRGPGVNALMKELESWWESKDFEPDRNACLAELGSRLMATSPRAAGT